MSRLEELLNEKADSLREFWFDVDGVMTPQGSITIYDVPNVHNLGYFERVNGIVSVRLVPCDTHGVPSESAVEYIAGYEGEPIMEGYRFDPRDGKVVEYLVENGFPVYFISGRDSACVRKRAIDLGAIPLLGIKDKYAMIKRRMRCSLDQILFVGDGIQDCEVLSKVGLAIAPADASKEAIQVAYCVTAACGGQGVLNEILTLFLKKRGLWPG